MLETIQRYIEALINEGRHVEAELWQAILKGAAPATTKTIEGAHYHNRGITIPVTLAGPATAATITCLIDTGEDASGLLLTGDVADKLALKLQTAEELAGIGGQAGASTAMLDYVELAGEKFTSVPVVVDPTYTGMPLIGLPFFQGFGRGLTIRPLPAAPEVDLLTLN